MNQTLLLLRYLMTPNVTMGMMRLGDTFDVYTLELPKLFDGLANVSDKTCIPAAKYQLAMLYSEKHRAPMPHVLGVPGRSAIEIHVGNTVRDILGCTVVGEAADVAAQSVQFSGVAFERLLHVMATCNPSHIDVREYVW